MHSAVLLVLLGGVASLGGVAVWRWLRRGRSVDALSNSLVDAWRMGEGAEAEALFARVKRELSGTRQHRRLASQLLDAEAFGWSAAICAQGLKVDPGDAALELTQAQAQASMLEPEGLDALGAHLRRRPGDVRSRLLLARSLLRLRRSEEVIRLLQREASVQGSAEVASLLGKAWFHLGQGERARRALEEARRLRQEQRRHTLSIYEGYMEGGQDVRQAPADFWVDEEERLYLEQIAQGEAPEEAPEEVLAEALAEVPRPQG